MQAAGDQKNLERGSWDIKQGDGYGGVKTEDNLPNSHKRSIWLDKFSYRSITKNVTCYALPGEILAIMGPSGAGKTTVMDFMAGRELNRFRGAQGCVKVNGKPRNRDFIDYSGHTPSQPHFIETLTVKETIDFTSTLIIRNRKLRKERVDFVIRELALQRCLDRIIGGALIKGISDGERKRLAIALQLLRTPSILLLDEPTSGLDTTSSRDVINILKDLANRGFTIVITIHSPDSYIYDKFDRLLMLVNGQVQYFGTSKQAVQAYCDATHSQIRNFQNPAEFLFECAATNTNGNGIATIRQDYPDPKVIAGENPQLPLVREDDASCCCCPGRTERVAKPCCLSQFFTLMRRTALDNQRNLAKYYIRGIIYIGIGVLIGSAWYDLKPTFTTLHDRQTMLMVIIVFYSFMQVASLPSFLNELRVMNSEVLDGMYPVGAHMAQSLIGGILPNFFLALFSSYVIFYSVGIGTEGLGYPLFLTNVFLLLYVAESFAEFLTTFLQNLLVALCVYAAFFTTSFIAMGLLRPLSHLPAWWKPFHYASFHRYSIEVFTWNAFHGWNVKCDVRPRMVCTIYRTGDDVLKARDMSTSVDDIYWDLYILIIQAMIYRFLSWVVLKARIWSNTTSCRCFR